MIMSTINYFSASISKFTSKSITSTRRALVTAATRPLQSKKDKDVADTCNKTKEAAEAVEQGAKEVRETCKFVTDTVETTAEKVSEVTKEAKEKAKGTVSGAWGVAKNATEIVKDKVVGK